MKNKWLWITLTVLLVLGLLVGTAFVFLRIGMMRSIARVTTSTGILPEGCVQLQVSEDGEIVKGTCELPEGTVLEGIPGTPYGYRGMMGQYFNGFDRFNHFDRFSYSPRYSMMGGRFGGFSALRFLGGLILLAVLAILVLTIVLIAKALSRKTKLIIKTQPEVVEVPPVEPTEQK